MNVETLKSRIRDVPDFPKAGVLFRDITPVLSHGDVLEAAIEHLCAPFRSQAIEQVLGIESRGFIFGSLVARELGVGFVPIRKAGKLPAAVMREPYSLEYGEDAVEMHVDALTKGTNALIVDDLIATGGTARAAAQLAERAGAHVVGLAFLIELSELGGRSVLGDRPVHAVVRY